LFEPIASGDYKLGQGWLGNSISGLLHLGQDYCVSARAQGNGLHGTRTFAIGPGRVTQTRYDEPAMRTDGVGNFAIVDHFNGTVAVYMHLARIYVTRGQLVSVQSVLGEAGDPVLHPAPNCPHLHLEIRTNGASGLNVSPNLRYGYVSKDGRSRLTPPLVRLGTLSQDAEGAVRQWVRDNFFDLLSLRSRNLLSPE
jgi:hypothetical protein